MTERLTELDCYDDYQILEEDLRKAIDKLGELEDILEEYGIESVEELEQELKIAHEIERLKDKNIDLNNAIIVFNKNFIKDYIREIEELKIDRDTWQKACELMGKTIQNVYPEPFYRFTEDIPNYFYQQASKKGR